MVVNAALADKLDRDPAVLMELEAAKREILTKAYVARHLAAIKPAEAEVKAYYEQHPHLFAQRKVYNLLSMRPDQRRRQTGRDRQTRQKRAPAWPSCRRS